MRRASLLKQLDTLTTWLECDDEERPVLFGSRDEYEWLLRLSTFTRSLLTRHQTNGTGRCRRCREPRKRVRDWLPGRRVRCQVVSRVSLFATSELDVVWWRALSLRGDNITLDEVRAWLSSSPEAAATEPAKHVAVMVDQRVRPYVRGDMPTSRMPVRPDEAVTQELPRVPRIHS